ncbi:MAG: hypothetical protein WCO68_11080, partial [Verrucomicrobiota bacterium]
MQKVDRALRARFWSWVGANKISSLRSMCFGKSRAERTIHLADLPYSGGWGFGKYSRAFSLNVFTHSVAASGV